jgi:hypothetical protein
MPQLLEEKSNVFEHDGAPQQIHNEVTAFLNRQLPERWIGRGMGVPFPGLRDLQI